MIDWVGRRSSVRGIVYNLVESSQSEDPSKPEFSQNLDLGLSEGR